MVEAGLPDGSRVNIVIPPLAVQGSSITIRKFSRVPYKVQDLVNFGTLNHDMANFIRACVRSRISMVVSGGTGSGKTTTLNVLSNFIPDTERVVTVEDTAELQLRQRNLVTLEARSANVEGRGAVAIRDLVVNALRMRPDRIVVGECRAAETLDMLQAMNTGHDGSMTTVHANSPKDASNPIETLVIMGGSDPPFQAVREQTGGLIPCPGGPSPDGSSHRRKRRRSPSRPLHLQLRPSRRPHPRVRPAGLPTPPLTSVRCKPNSRKPTPPRPGCGRTWPNSSRRI